MNEKIKELVALWHGEPLVLHDLMGTIETAFLERALEIKNHNVTQASRILSVTRCSLYEKMRRFNIERKNPSMIGKLLMDPVSGKVVLY